MMNSMMIDIETLDTESTAIVLSIGGCVFNEREQTTESDLRKNSIYLELNTTEQEHRDRTISIDTLNWWLKTNPLELTRFSNIKTNNIEDDLKKLVNFILENKVKYIWSKSPSFDMLILNSLFN